MLGGIARGAAISLGGALFGAALHLSARAVLARTLGPTDYGRVVLGLTVIFLLSGTATLGLAAGTARFVSEARALNDRVRLKSVIRDSILVGTISGIVASALLFLAAAPLAERVFHDPDLRPVFEILALFAPALILGLILGAVIRGFEKMKSLAALKHFAGSGGEFALVGLASLAGFDLRAMVWILGLSFLVTMIVGIVLLVRTAPALFRDWLSLPTTSSARELLTFSWPLLAAQQLGQLRGRADTLLLGVFLPSGAVGLYNAAAPIARMLQLGLSAINTILMPSVTGLFARGQMESLRHAYRSSARWIFFVTLPMFLLILSRSEDMLVVVFGDGYVAAEAPLMILAAGVFVNTVSGSFGETLVAVGKPKINMVTAVVSLGVNLVLNFLLIPAYGIVGAAVAAAVSLLSATLVGGGHLYRRYGLHPFSRPQVGYLFAVSIALGTGSVISSFLTEEPGVLPLVVTTVTMLLVLSLLVPALGLISGDDRELAYRAWTRLMKS